jgi:phenylpropionate dioxygenase-like ring-hydroxylating dioxygenase large terminal subunit
MLREYWYIACAASRLSGEPLAAAVLDRELVLFRDREGVPHALLDRCCHRGVRLSLGVVQDGTLACGYHGWRYDGAGRCVEIPSLTAERRIPEGVGVGSFPCVEQDSYVWVWLGSGAPTPPPRLAGLDRYRWLQGSMPFRCDALKVIENNLDWCHPVFAHVGTHPYYFFNREVGFTEYPYEVRVTERGMTLFAPVTDAADEPIPEHTVFVAHFELPDRIRVEFPVPGGDRMVVVMHAVPTGTNTCRLEWAYSTFEPCPDVSWTDEDPEVLAQDRRLLESSQPWYDRAGDAFERSVEADGSTLLVRRIIALAARGEWEAKRASLPQRRLVPIRG